MAPRDPKLKLLEGVPLFAQCSKKELKEVAAIADEIDLSAGRKLTTQDADGQEFVVIDDGTAEVIKGEDVVNQLGAGDFFGEIALLTGAPRTASVVASTDVRALVIEGHAFRRLLEDAPDIREKVERALAERS